MQAASKAFQEAFGPDASLGGCDFRPNLNGWLLNACRVVQLAPTRDAQMQLVWLYAQEMAQWILAHRQDFGSGDKFQLIVGWPIQVRRNARQIIKFGGDFEILKKFTAIESYTAFGEVFGGPFFRQGWDIGVFEKKASTK